PLSLARRKRGVSRQQREASTAADESKTGTGSEASQSVRWQADSLPSRPANTTLKSSTKDPTMDENKKRALSAALTQIEKQFGKGSVMRMGDRVAEIIPVIPTGSLLLDIALGIGG